MKSTKNQSTASHKSVTGLNTPDAWEDRTLSQIFQVTLTEETIKDGYILLDDLRKGLENDFQSGEIRETPRLSLDRLDEVILSIFSSNKVDPMDLMIRSWRRAMKVQRETPSGRLDKHKLNILAEARRMCENYALYCITQPDLCGYDIESPRPQFILPTLNQRLLYDMNEDRGLPQEILAAFGSKLNDEPELADKFRQAFRFMSATLSTMNMTDNYKPYVHALGRISLVRPLAELMVELPEFLHDGEPQDLEKVMLLGPYFRISPLQPEVSKQYFSNCATRTATSIKEAQFALRMSLQTLQNDLYQIITQFCKTCDRVRSRVLDFFAKSLNANHKRVAIQVDHKTIASDGFMVNLTAVLNRLCEPFMDNSFLKIDRIDIDYFRRNPRLEIGAETKLNADDQSSRDFYSHQIQGNNNFITEVFFLNAAAHHIGLGSAQTRLESLVRDIPEMTRHLERIETDRQNHSGVKTLQRNIEKIKERIDDALAYKASLEGILLDPTLAAPTLLFMRYQMVWLLRVVDINHEYPRLMPILPLPEPSPQEFNHLPEYMIESVGHLLSFISIHNPQVLIPTQLTELLTFAVTFLRSSSYIQKATLKSKLVEIIFLGVYDTPYGRPGYLVELIHGNSFVLEHLMHALMNFYIEIEKHYYEKFTVRFQISKIIQKIWSNEKYRAKLEQESACNAEFFIRFVALLLNDVTYVLDNALTALSDIHRLQNELERNIQDLSEEVRGEKEAALSKAERDAQSYMQLGNETVAMLNLFTSTIGDAFVQPEIVSRLAGMLNFNLEALVGPRCNSLRVRQPEKYRFNPKALLGEITNVYLNLSSKTAFVEAIARDGRSYRSHIFEDALKILRRHSLKGNDEIRDLSALANRVAEAKRRDDEGELELGEIPEEFTDPLMATLMEDPVILPSSRVTIDRQTIKVHLLSDAKDPFNRAPLKIEDVVPDVELKLKIDTWVKERRALGKESSVGDRMDLDT
ncbi:ubiquitin elongating factor core-domain-containing protein [Geopyxis carbonaria]|nr:ubiquitin elongating factor core-domain-containing protein [Geopyxis carbonaria]